MIILTKKIAPFSSPTNMVNLRGSDELPTSGAIEAEGFSVDLIVGLMSKLVQPDTTITIQKNMSGCGVCAICVARGVLKRVVVEVSHRVVVGWS